MNDDGLWLAVADLSDVMQGLPDEMLEQEWIWRDHNEGVRFALLGTMHELRDLAVDLLQMRQAAGLPISSTQHLLSQYHSAFRDLQAVLMGVDDTLLDLAPAPGEWPLRRVLGHMIGADLTFYVLVHYAVDWQREELTPRKVMGDEADSLVGTEKAFEQTMDEQGLAGIWNYYDAFHWQVLEKAANWDEEDLAAPSVFWEKEPLSVRYRLHRFDAHLRQHTIQAEKTLAGLGWQTNEAKRLLRLVFSALSEVENQLIGSQHTGMERRQETAAAIKMRANEIREMMALE